MICKAKVEHLSEITMLALKLWPDNDRREMQEELSAILHREDAAFFLAIDAGKAVGFAQCQLRRDYVEGTGSSPVGYLEGIYVEADHRHRDIARKLLTACEAWAKSMGCREFASDCELENAQSLRFHMAVGFTEANRIICFTKKL